MNFSNVKAWTIPEGNVKKVTLNGVDIWQKESAPPVDKYTWQAVIASVNAGTYRNDYSIGDLIPLDLGAEGNINMQIAGIDVDDLADGSGKAPMTFISKELLITSHRMNPARSGSSGAYVEGTGTIGGWLKSEMRAYLKETIKPLIPAEVRAAILEVTKTSNAFNTAGKAYQQTTQDDVWIPSTRDLAYSDPKETSGPMYSEMFPDLASHVKCRVGTTSATYWWTRSANTNSTFRYVKAENGDHGAGNSNTLYLVALGFCIGRTTSN